MKKFLFFLVFSSSLSFGQVSTQEFELIKTYKKNLVDKNLEQTIQSLQNLINYHQGETQYHISLGYIYQLQRNKKLAKVHLDKGRSYILDQLITEKLSPKQTMDHVVALCFAGFVKDCEEMFTFTESRFINDEYYSEFDFVSIKKLAENQRKIMNNFFENK